MRRFLEDSKALEQMEVAVHDFDGPVRVVDAVRASMARYQEAFGAREG